MALIFGNFMVVLTALLSIACVVAYQFTTGGAWKTTETGRHLMAFMCSEAAVMTLALLRQILVSIGITDPSWFYLLRLVVFLSIPFVFAWRLRLIILAYLDRPHEPGVLSSEMRFEGKGGSTDSTKESDAP